MAEGCSKCDPHELCEECPEWIFTLADLIMCMMGLFVLLWVLKPGMDKTQEPQPPTVQADMQWLETVGEIRGGFGWIPDPNSSDPVDQAMIARRKRLAGPGANGVSKIEAKGADGTDPEVMTIRAGKHSTTGGKLVFPAGDSSISQDLYPTLNAIAAQIRGHRQIVMIRGHTSLDDFPEGASAQQKMDLSLRRAQAIADYLVSGNVSPDTIRVLGCSTFEPVAQRVYGAASQAANRRVEVDVTSTLVEEMQDPAQRGK